MNRTVRLLRAVAPAAVAAAFVSPACAQQFGSTAPGDTELPPDYQVQANRFGNFRLEAGGEVRAEYDNNIFAEPTVKTDDIVLQARGYANLDYEGGTFAARLRTSVNARMLADHSLEDAESARIAGELAWLPSAGQSLTARASVAREVEDRGDPEARQILGIGPRLFDIYDAGLQYRRQGTRFLIDAEATAQQIDALSAIDSDRDYKSYAGRTTVGVNVASAVFVTANGFVNRREFRIESLAGNDRDTTTYGAQLGLEFDTESLVDGRIAAGIFNLNYDDPLRDSHTGFSLAGQLTYRPRRRTEIALNLFNGDVASFRGGASARTDTRATIGLRQEIRHNLFARLTGGYQRSKYLGSGLSERTWLASGETEWLLNRNFSVIAYANYADRGSDIAFEEFERFRAGAGLRFRF